MTDDAGDHTVVTVAHAEDDLGRSVVACHDVWRHHEAGAGSARQAKVQNLQRAVALHHYVGWLQVLQ